MEHIKNKSVDIAELLQVLWNHRIFIIAVTAIFLIFSIFYSYSLSNKYQATALLMPSSAEDDSQSLIQRYSGLASLASISLPEKTVSNTDFMIETLKSRSFTSSFIENRNILIDLIAINSWNPKDNSISYDPDIYDSKSGKWVRDVKFPKLPKPSSQEAYDFWKKNVFSIYKNPETGLITIKIIHQSPHIAKNIVDWLIKDINQSISQDVINETTSAINYLNTEINKTQSTELKGLLSSLIIQNTQKRMMATINNDYALEIIDGPIAPENKYSPNRSLICILAIMIGLTISSIFVLIKNYFSSKI